jgi:hypothetical protein
VLPINKYVKPNRSASSTRAFWFCAAGVLLVYAAFFPAVIYSVDGNSMVAVAESLVTGHGFTVANAGLGVPGVHGLYYSMWYPLQSILAAPLVAIGVYLSRAVNLPQHYVAAMFALMLSTLIGAATALTVASLGRRLGASSRGCVAAALAFAFGTIALVYSRAFFADPLLALLSVAGICFALDRKAGCASATAALAILAKPTGIVLGPCIAAYLICRRSGLAKWLLPLCGTAAGLLIYFGYNWMRFRNPLDFGQPNTFSLRFAPIGLAGLLASPGAGIFWYCPALIAMAGLRRDVFRRWDSGLIMAVAAAYLAEHAIWLHWEGGWSWGPRLILPAVPGLMAMTALLEKRRRTWLAVFTAVGIAVSAPTMVSFYERYYQEANAASISPQARMWNPRYAVIFRVWGSAARETSDAYHNADRVAEFARQAGGTPASTVNDSRALRIVNVWWWMLPAVGIPRAAGAAVSLLLLIGGIWLMAAALARAPDDDATSSRQQTGYASAAAVLARGRGRRSLAP